jgi:hypothetical protein
MFGFKSRSEKLLIGVMGRLQGSLFLWKLSHTAEQQATPTAATTLMGMWDQITSSAGYDMDQSVSLFRTVLEGSKANGLLQGNPHALLGMMLDASKDPASRKRMEVIGNKLGIAVANREDITKVICGICDDELSLQRI